MCRVYKYIYGVFAEYMIINHARDHASSSDSVKSLATTERKYLNVEIIWVIVDKRILTKKAILRPWLIERAFNERVCSVLLSIRKRSGREKGNTALSRARARSFLTTQTDEHGREKEETAISWKVSPTACQPVFVGALHLIPESMRDDCLPLGFRWHETFKRLVLSLPDWRRRRSLRSLLR